MNNDAAAEIIEEHTILQNPLVIHPQNVCVCVCLHLFNKIIIK